MGAEARVIYMAGEGFGALMNHCISFICSSLVSVEGWNSSSIHFLAAASSADAGAARAPMKAVSAMALAIVVRRLVTVMRLMVSSIGETKRKGWPVVRLCLISLA